jgi:ATP-dependent exoDNAse (exonuclease V) beta subunit
VELDALTEEQHILDLLSLTRAIHQLADRLSWIACLRARFCGLTLADFSTLLEDQRKTTVYELLLDDERLMRLTTDGRRRALRFRQVMTAAVESFGRHPIRKVVEAAWMSLGGPAALAEENEREDASSFLSLLEASDAGGRISDFSLFEERLKFLFAKPGKHEGPYVQVMTIHKAKGLQFDTVILPQLNGMSRRNDEDLLAWATRLGADGEEGFLLAGLPQSGTEEPDAYYKFVTSEAREKDKAEECRLFYVAVTRARNALHLLGNAKSKKSGGVCKPSGGFLKLLWMDERVVEQFSAVWKKQAAQSAQQTLALTAEKKTILRRLPQHWGVPTAAPGIPWRPAYRTETPSEREPTYEWVSETGRHVGTVVHELLRRIAEEGVHRWTPGRVDQLTALISSELTRLGVASGERPAAITRVLTAVKNVITSERGRWILSPHTQAECEWALGGMLSDRLESSRIDRTFIDETGVRWIVDYKTSSHEGAARDIFLAEQKRRYQAQLETYARLLQQSGECRVAVGLYFPLLDEWLEWSVMEAEPLGTGA